MKTVTTPEKETQEKHKTKRNEVPWPENLLAEIGFDLVFGTEEYTPLTADQAAGLEYALNLLKEIDKTLILLHFKDHKNYTEIGRIVSRDGSTVRDRIHMALRKLQNPVRHVYIKDGLEAVQKRQQEEARREQELIDEKRRRYAAQSKEREEKIPELSKVSIMEVDLYFQIQKPLWEAGFQNLGQIVSVMNTDPEGLLKIKWIGKNYVRRILDVLEEYGVDTMPYRDLYSI